MNKKIKVLVFPAGEVNSVELHDALCCCVNIELIGASSVDRHGGYLFENYVSGLPMITDPAFIPEFNRLLTEREIDLVFPTHDTVALFLAKQRHQLNAKVMTAEVRTAQICRDKKLTYELFREEDFCPAVYPMPERFPCFAKPRDGQGGKGGMYLQTADDVPANTFWENFVVCEYLPGSELTVDCLTDRNGKLATVLPRSRERLLAGISVAGTSMKATEEIQYIAERINDKLSFLGLWYFQLREDAEGHYKLMEISTRCAGTMCLSRARGINLPLLSVYAAMGRDVTVFENPYHVTMDRTLISRYRLDYSYRTVYIDYDDTIIVNDMVCLPVIRFLYQCRNRKVRVILLTRHSEDHRDTVRESMQHYALSPGLFDEIVEIGSQESKARHIKDPQSVFIDNSYTERLRVHNTLGIPVFDVEGIEVLTDWRS